MSYFIVINGPLGSGKTTNAKKLTYDLKGEYISLDQLLKENDLEDIESDSGIRASSFVKALDMVIPVAKKCLTKNTIVVFDGCFYHKEVLDHLIDNLDYPHYLFTLEAPVETCIERDKCREVTLGEDAAKAVHNLVSDLAFGNIVDADRNFEETYQDILSYLPQDEGLFV